MTYDSKIEYLIFLYLDFVERRNSLNNVESDNYRFLFQWIFLYLDIMRRRSLHQCHLYKILRLGRLFLCLIFVNYDGWDFILFGSKSWKFIKYFVYHLCSGIRFICTFENFQIYNLNLFFQFFIAWLCWRIRGREK